MADTIGMGLQGLGQAARAAWYFGLNQVVNRQSRRMPPTSTSAPPQTSSASARPTPSTREILTDLAQLMLRDAAAVRDGIYPPMPDGGTLREHLARARAMLADLPDSLQRRRTRDASTVRSEIRGSALPDYYAQDFHFQTGGYLTDHSAKLYDVQVETLFLGGAGPMRREALRPIAEFMRGRDQRTIALLDVACGTGRFLHDCRIAWPAMQLTGLDLSPAYLDEARRHMRGLRPARLLPANAEAIPLPDASQDIVVCIFLFHELPPDVRRCVTAEMARVLKPGGLLVFIDSLQLGDRPGWDSLLEAFPVRFHEPFFRSYIIDDLDQTFTLAGLRLRSQWTSFFSKVSAWSKPD
jgi:ubiquinone/menaquinone biosynthesis C-methylase UbiE